MLSCILQDIHAKKGLGLCKERTNVLFSKLNFCSASPVAEWLHLHEKVMKILTQCREVMYDAGQVRIHAATMKVDVYEHTH
jgi:hypothetical protein